ncbi:MAG: glycosyltransferase [Flavobacteriales bacterium]
MSQNRVKILLVADAQSSHTVKWARALIDRGLQVHIFSFRPSTLLPLDIVTVARKYPSGNSRWKKVFELFYFYTTGELKKLIKKQSPNVLHAHYASSYGLVARLTKFHPFYISTWGSDVFAFPRSNSLSKNILTGNLQKADKVFATSHTLQKETALYTNKNIEYVPFGVDTEIFSPEIDLKNDNSIRVGLMKSMEYIYGVDLLLRAFQILLSENKTSKIELHLYGDGSQISNLKELAILLHLNDSVFFHGRIPPDLVPSVVKQFDILVNPSREESFGVAVVEAMACEVPVVVTRVGGLTEVVDDEINGLIANPEDHQHLAAQLQRLVDSPELRKSLGKSGRQKVLNEYDWNKIMDDVVKKYYLPLKKS